MQIKAPQLIAGIEKLFWNSRVLMGCMSSCRLLLFYYFLFYHFPCHYFYLKELNTFEQ